MFGGLKERKGQQGNYAKGKGLHIEWFDITVLVSMFFQ